MKLKYVSPTLEHLSLLELNNAVCSVNYLIKRCNLSKDVINILELFKRDLQIEIYRRSVYNEKV